MIFFDAFSTLYAFSTRLMFRMRLCLGAALSMACVCATSLQATPVEIFSGQVSWNFVMELTDIRSFGDAAPDTLAIGAQASKVISSRYTAEVERDFYGPGRDDYLFFFTDLTFGTRDPYDAPRLGSSKRSLTFGSDSGPLSVENDPGNACGFIINYCVGNLALGGAFMSVRSSLQVGNIVLADDPDNPLDPNYPVEFYLSEEVIFENTQDGSLVFLTAEGRSLPTGAISVIPLPASAVLLASAGAFLVGLRRRRRRVA